MALGEVMFRGLRQRCPQCGGQPVFARWGVLADGCAACGCVIAAREDDTWFAMYVSTAGITGVFVLFMLAVVPRHAAQGLGRLIVGIAATLFFFGTMSVRKSLAIAWDYWLDSRSEHPRHPSQKP